MGTRPPPHRLYSGGALTASDPANTATRAKRARATVQKLRGRGGIGCRESSPKSRALATSSTARPSAVAIRSIRSASVLARSTTRSSSSLGPRSTAIPATISLTAASPPCALRAERSCTSDFTAQDTGEQWFPAAAAVSGGQMQLPTTAGHFDRAGHDGLSLCRVTGHVHQSRNRRSARSIAASCSAVAIRSVSSASLSAKSIVRRCSPSLPSAAATRATIPRNAASPTCAL